jgi:hypothetical protein
MPMTLNIKDPEAHKLAKALQEDLLTIGRRCASALKTPAVDHGRLLYDERGLPR